MAPLRRVLTASILALSAFGLMLAGTGAAHAQDAAGGLDGTFTVAESRPGDRLLYAVHMVRIEEGEKGGWAYDAGARLEVERMGDRVMPVDGTPQVVSSFASTWITRDIDWGDWLFDWQMDAAMAELGRQMDNMPSPDCDNAADQGDWDQYGECMGEWGDDLGEWGENLGEIFSNLWGVSPRVVGEPWHVAHVDASQRVVATTRAGADPDLPGNRLAADLGLDTRTTIVTTPGTSSTPCGFHSGLQGVTVDLADAVRVSGDCPPAGGHFGTPADELTSDRFMALGHDVVQGRPAVVFGHEDGADNLRLWFTEDNPYPVRMVVPVLVFEDYYVHLLYEMTEFEQGTLTGAEAPPAPVLLPRLQWGPDATGVVDHPFPLEQALQAAATDQENTAVGEWLTAHPDAAIDEAAFVRMSDQAASTSMERWTFSLVSGGDLLQVAATRGAPYEGPTNDWPAGAPPLPAGTMPPEARALFDDGVVVESQDGSSAGHVLPPEMPADLPNVADLLALWRSDGAAGGVPAWSFRLRPDGSTWIAVGHAEAAVHWEDAQDGSALIVDSLAYSYYGVGPDGALRFVEESPTRDGYDVPPAEDPDNLANADPESDDDWNDPDGYALASLGYWAFPETTTTAAVTAAAGLVGLLAYLLLPAKFGAMGLFSRIGSGQVLEHPLRAQITDLVTAEPGIHFQELVRRLDAGRGTMEHHLRKLVAANVLTMQVSQGFTCFFPKGKVDRHLMAAAPVLKSDGARQILQAIAAQPGRAAQDVAASIGLTPSTVNYHLKRLVSSGLVSHERKGRFILLTPTPLGTQALGAWGQS